MRWICLLFAVISFISFMSDLGMIQFPVMRVLPSAGNSSPTVLTLLLFIAILGMLGRMLKMAIKGEKEELKERIKKLEGHIKKYENDLD